MGFGPLARALLGTPDYAAQRYGHQQLAMAAHVAAQEGDDRAVTAGRGCGRERSQVPGARAAASAKIRISRRMIVR